MHIHALVERSVLNYRILTGPLRLLAEPKNHQPQTTISDSKELNAEEIAILDEAEALNPFIPSID